MFFVSEEFLRKYEQDENDVEQTIGEAVKVGDELFDHTTGKREYNVKRKKNKKSNSDPKDTVN